MQFWPTCSPAFNNARRASQKHRRVRRPKTQPAPAYLVQQLVCKARQEYRRPCLHRPPGSRGCMCTRVACRPSLCTSNLVGTCRAGTDYCSAHSRETADKGLWLRCTRFCQLFPYSPDTTCTRSLLRSTSRSPPHRAGTSRRWQCKRWPLHLKPSRWSKRCRRQLPLLRLCSHTNGVPTFQNCVCDKI